MFQAARNSRQEYFLEAELEIEKWIADLEFSYGFADKGKKDLSIAVGQRDWAKFDGSVAGPDLWRIQKVARCQEGGIQQVVQTPLITENKRRWRVGQPLRITFEMQLGPGADEFRRDWKTA